MANPLDPPWLLGAVRGATEMLPLSSRGHVALASLLFGASPGDAPAAALIPLGIFAAALWAVRARARDALTEGVRHAVRPALLAQTRAGRDAKAVAVATIPTAVVALALEGPAAAWSTSPAFVGVCMLASAIAVGSTRWAPRGDEEAPSGWGAVLAGVAQGAAVLPGLSRTATTLAALLWLGVRAERAFELSVLMALPALAAAAALAMPQALQGGGPTLAALGAAAAACVAALVALRALRGIVARRSVALFALYLAPLGMAALAWAWARP